VPRSSFGGRWECCEVELATTDEGGHVQFMALIYGEEGRWESLSEDDRRAVYARYGAFADEARAAGVLAGGEELGATSGATTVRIRDGQALVTDGPYAETKEALGGFFLLECASWDDALDWAAKIPGAESGAVEVRPVHEQEEEESP
jgi:hypothetical protein